ncbi:MAG: response regulator [Treponema sp.]|nr:response regulator [Treponema sp.]
MNIIAVDDEKYLLADIEKTIKEAIEGAWGSSTVKSFRKPIDALEYAKENCIDTAFLDIKMIGMNGLELAKKLKDINKNTNIVFVTGYSEYAVDSYSIPASGYILKPVTKEAVLNAMKYLRNPVEVKTEGKIRVQTFGNFDVFIENKPLMFGRSKAKEAFAYLIDRKGSYVTSAEIAAILWEDKKYDRSLQNQTQVIISCMMKTLKDNKISDVIIKGRNQIAVDKSKIKCDYYDFLNWDIAAVNAYVGEYMANYSWAEMTAGELMMKRTM